MTARQHRSAVRPVRHTPWPSRRTPLVAGGGRCAGGGGGAVGLSHRPTQGSAPPTCAASSTSTPTSSPAPAASASPCSCCTVDAGTSQDVKTAVNVAKTASANCSPANNELLDDLTSVQTPESLASYRLGRAITALIDWAAPRAEQAAADVATVCPTAASRPRPPTGRRCARRCVSSTPSGGRRLGARARDQVALATALPSAARPTRQAAGEQPACYRRTSVRSSQPDARHA